MVDRKKTNRDDQAAYKTRMRDRGYVQIGTWVKKEHIDQVKEYIKSLNGDPSENDTIIEDDCVNIPFFREVSLPSDGEEKTIKLDHEVNLHFSRRSLKKVGVKPQNVAYVKVSGNSMNPVMSDGSIVIIDTDNNVIVDGDIYVINQHNNLRVKIIYRIPSGGLRLRSFNSTEWPDEFYDKIDDIVILGRVFWYSSFK